MGGMTLDSVSLTGTGEQDIDVKTEEGGVDKDEDEHELSKRNVEL